MDTLESKKEKLGDLTREEQEQVLCQFAEDVFAVLLEAFPALSSASAFEKTSSAN